jgi:hypothetical protein
MMLATAWWLIPARSAMARSDRPCSACSSTMSRSLAWRSRWRLRLRPRAWVGSCGVADWTHSSTS